MLAHGEEVAQVDAGGVLQPFVDADLNSSGSIEIWTGMTAMLASYDKILGGSTHAPVWWLWCRRHPGGFGLTRKLVYNLVRR